MEEISCAPEDLFAASEAFREAGTDCLAIMDRLNVVVEGLESQWSGAAQQSFYKSHVEWNLHMNGLATLLKSISTEMEALGQRFADLDR